MRIIKSGKVPSKEKEKTCPTCKAIFAYLPSDITFNSRERDFVKCPCYSSLIDV